MWTGVEEERMRLASIMDSGATGSVPPASTCPLFPLTEFQGSWVGQQYRKVGGGRLKNKVLVPIAGMDGGGAAQRGCLALCQVANPLISCSTQ